ncbi:unnamed protein product [Microthlaspi erraticum]|uniref:Putative plant transposon protein domain-containing protein n=1 Tax=Microthlaspi erraticum TaxID=1685480 RepID=A0A6D2K2A3_9BRAS|nr:unnamed protein product [Microthlaspi erraticum]
MVTATQGRIRPIQNPYKKYSDGSAFTPVQINESSTETPISNSLSLLSNMQEGAIDEVTESVFRIVPYDDESEEEGGEIPAVNKPKNPEDEQSTKPTDLRATKTLDPPLTEEATGEVVTTPPVVTVEVESSTTAMTIPESNSSIPPPDPKSVASPSRIEDEETLDELNPGQPFRSEQREVSPDPLTDTAPKIPSPPLLHSRYASSDEHQSEDDVCLDSRKRKVLRSTGLPPPSKKQKAQTAAASSTPPPKAAKPHSTQGKKTPTHASTRAKGKAKQTSVPKSKKKASVDRFASFKSRGIIDERIFDLKVESHWGYPEIIIRGGFKSTVVGLGCYVRSLIVDFYSALPETRDESVKLLIRNQEYVFSPAVINEFLRLPSLTEEEMKQEADADSVSMKELAQLFTDNEEAEWSEIYTLGLTPCFAALVIVASHNWLPSTHRNHVSEERAKIIYKLYKGIRVNFGQLMYDQVMSMARFEVNESRWLVFPRILYGVLQMQDPLPLIAGDSICRPLHYHKDKRSGKEYQKREEDKKKKESKASASRVCPPAESASESTSEGFVTVELGSVRFPTPPLQPAAAI